MVRKPEPEDRTPSWFETGIKFILKFQRFTKDFAGIILLVLSSLTFLSLIGLTSGAWLTPWASWLRKWFGIGGVFLVMGLGIVGLFLLRKQSSDLTIKDWGRIIWLEVSSFSFLGLLSIVFGHSIERAESGMDGGLVGWGLAEFFGILLRSLPSGIANFIIGTIFVVLMIFGILYGFGWIGKVILKLEESFSSTYQYEQNKTNGRPVVSVGEMKVKSAIDSHQIIDNKLRKQSRIPQEFRKQFKVEDQEDDRVDVSSRDKHLPPLELLLGGESIKPNERHINQTAGLIEKTLAEFSIPVKVVGFKVGPTITQFAIEPGFIDKNSGMGGEGRQKVRVSQISTLKRDLALALSAERLRIQAPVPGRSFIGIEVPNKKSNVVRLKTLLETEAFHQLKSPLAIALGRNVSGQPVVTDLVRMPHLLIAGTTGSGKSVCIASIATCLAMNNTPDDLRMVMIDPKMVELVRFNGLPHLFGKAETKLDRITGVLHWVVIEMQRRYKLLEELRARDIDSYNRKVLRRKEYEHLPRIVVLIDELADLMMMAADQTETTIVRLAQMARATGIHLVIATQRPSTDVVTGLIKANFPARISFTVASGVDSRVILDTSGAENLLGRGDMLFLNPEDSLPVRVQGVMISDKEIDNVIQYWKGVGIEDESGPPWDVLIEQDAVNSGQDDLIEIAIEIIRETGRASTSMIQRRLKVGYPRAARLMDELEDIGIVGPSQGGGREREILIDVNQELE
ncbi:MAG: DNA translocase FtsK [Anaerolineales bacterium]|jgi:S-DNA-T family DNA segregation ATPase FtsK/SpoIIIE